MAIKTPKDGLILLPKQEVLGGMKNASAEELKLLIYMFAEPDAAISDAARDLGITVAQAESAFAFWRGAGVFQDAEPTKKKAATDTSSYRNYDSATLSKAIKDNEEFSLVCRVAGDRLQKQLTKNDYSSLYYLFDFVGIPAPVICGVVEMCTSMGKRSLQYIFKKALALYEEGIDTYDKFEIYLAKREAINSNIGKLRKLCGMGDRALTPKETQLFDCWFGDWKFPFETVKLAYEKTIDTTGKLSTTYMNGILRRWHESGFETPEDIAKGEASRNTGVESSFEGDEFITAALKRGFND
ncbi:MAG: DnaD domain protein [Ruminococcaceae bacterium]|nr:DnaD domain protein [Oscillospiraceae bacterium]